VGGRGVECDEVVAVTFSAELRSAYGQSAETWEQDASLVYRPLAVALVDRCPDEIDGARVLDAGAGTGVVSDALVERGSRVIAVDLSHAMLARHRGRRPACAVGDVLALPLGGGVVEAAVAAFVVNHLIDPTAGLVELGRVTTRGGPILANAFSTVDRFPVKAEIERVATRHGWSAPPWYRTLQERAMPTVGSADVMMSAALGAGLLDVDVREEPVAIGRLSAEQLVRYRLGMPQLREHLRSLTETERRELFEEAVDAVRAVQPTDAQVAPVVVTLVARSPG
jgi:SAM-dependent methyltransferase